MITLNDNLLRIYALSSVVAMVSGEVKGHAGHAKDDQTFSKITHFSITKKIVFFTKKQFLVP